MGEYTMLPDYLDEILRLRNELKRGGKTAEYYESQYPIIDKLINTLLDDRK